MGFTHSFQAQFIDKYQNIDTTEIGKSIFSSRPKWVNKLFAIRNKLAGIIGLKTYGKLTARQLMLDNFKGKKGEQIGHFKVLDMTTDEMTLGEVDIHSKFQSVNLITPLNFSTTHAMFYNRAVRWSLLFLNLCVSY